MSEAAGRFLEILGQVQPRKAVILGSGLGALPADFESLGSFPQSAVSDLPPGSVVGHAGRIDVGYWAGRAVIVCQGRVHHYEGHSASKVTALVERFPSWGVRELLLFNATGGIEPGWAPGTAVWIDSYWDATGPLWNAAGGQPLWQTPTGLSTSESFAVMGAMGLPRGRFVMVSGPSYETRAEIRALRVLGAQVVGMSSVFELDACRRIGLSAHLISVIANHACGITDAPLSHAEVCEVMAGSVGRMQTIVDSWLQVSKSVGRD